jgi:hypothetical protein
MHAYHPAKIFGHLVNLTMRGSGSVENSGSEHFLKIRGQSTFCRNNPRSIELLPLA